jgi:hypothetical protein
MVHDHRQEVDEGGQERPSGLGHLKRSHGHGELHGVAILLHPHLHRLATDQAQVSERADPVVVVAGGGRSNGGEAVDVDPDMVVIDVLELRVEHGVEFDGKEVVPRAAVADVDEALEVAWQRCGEVLARGFDKGRPGCSGWCTVLFTPTLYMTRSYVSHVACM